jgi:hypothetical protein
MLAEYCKTPLTTHNIGAVGASILGMRNCTARW